MSIRWGKGITWLGGMTVAVTVLYVTNRYGIGASPDTVTYLSVAQSLDRGKGFVAADGQAMVEFPPLYPIVIALTLRLFPHHALDSLRFLTALLSGLSAGVSLYIAQRLLCHPLTYATAVVLLWLGVPLWSVFVMGWSEPLFIVCTLVWILASERYMLDPSLRHVALMAATAQLRVLTRYIGVLSVLLGILVIITVRGLPLRTRGKHSLIFLLLALALPILWGIHNVMVSGTLLGERVPSARSLMFNTKLASKVIGNWFFPGDVVQRMGHDLLGLLVLCPVVAIGWGWVRRVLVPAPLLVLLAVYAVLYVGLLVISASRVAYDALDNRLLSPAYVPLVLALLGSYEAVALHVARTAVRRWLVLMPLVVLLSAPITCTPQSLIAVHEEGVDFTSARWWQSSALKFLRAAPGNEPLYTNCPEAIYLHTGRHSKLLPRRFYYATHLPVLEDIRTFQEEVQEYGEVLILWFTTEPTPYLYSPPQLRQRFPMRLERRFADAMLYRLRARPAQRGNKR